MCNWLYKYVKIVNRLNNIKKQAGSQQNTPPSHMPLE